MNVFISADIEGVCGAAAWSETMAGKPDGDYAYFKDQMSREAAAACRAAVKSGATRILVKDAHDTGRNINPALLPEEAQINRGWSGDIYCMMSGIQHGVWDAVAMIGYHAAAHSAGNPLSHTMSTKIDALEINGARADEFTINAYMAGYHDIPVCFISGDAAVCESARRLVPAIAATPVNKGDGGSATSLHPDLAVRRIEDAFHDQLESERYRQCIVPMPAMFEVVIRYKEHYDAYRASFYPGAAAEDEKTISYTTVDYLDVLRLLHFVL